MNIPVSMGECTGNTYCVREKVNSYLARSKQQPDKAGFSKNGTHERYHLANNIEAA